MADDRGAGNDGSAAAPTLLEEVRARLQVLGPTALDLRDDSARHAGHAGSNGGGHLVLRIVSPQFDGLGTVARHRRIYAEVGDLMPARLHALAITALTPREAAALAAPEPEHGVQSRAPTPDAP
ncbi:MAG: BolA family transcriptional regulator [Rhodocyclaceae bacterium]|nr:BolA family transcriptional regulator [Rhodocyclaceae bacterium]